MTIVFEDRMIFREKRLYDFTGTGAVVEFHCTEKLLKPTRVLTLPLQNRFLWKCSRSLVHHRMAVRAEHNQIFEGSTLFQAEVRISAWPSIVGRKYMSHFSDVDGLTPGVDKQFIGVSWVLTVAC